MTITVNKEALVDDLLISYDFSNPKSLIGPPLTNGAIGITPVTSTGTGFSVLPGAETVFVPGLGTMETKFSTIQNNYPTVSPACCIMFMSYVGGRIGVLPNTQYTYGIVYKADSGYTHPNFMYRYEFTSGGTYLTEAGIHSTTDRIHLGGGWYWAWATFTSQPTAGQMELYAFYYQYSTGTDKVSIARVLFTTGNYTSLHPKYWPDPLATRAPTATVRNLIGATAPAAVTTGWDVTGKPYWGGDGSTINIGSSAYNLGIRRYATFAGWVAPASFTGVSATVISDYSPNGGTGGQPGNGMTLRLSSATLAEFYVYPQNHRASFAGSFQLGTWYYLVGVMDNANVYLYINGVQVASAPLGESIGPSDQTLKIGGRGDVAPVSSPSMIGWVNTTQVYKRALTPAEILALFNSQRGAYGV